MDQKTQDRATEGGFRLRRLAADFGSGGRSRLPSIGGCCCTTSCSHSLTMAFGGMAAGGVLGLHIPGVETRSEQWKTAILTGIGGLFIGSFAAVPVLLPYSGGTRYDSLRFWQLAFPLIFLSLLLVGLITIRWGRRRGEPHYVSGALPRRTYWLLVSSSVPFAAFCSAAFTGLSLGRAPLAVGSIESGYYSALLILGIALAILGAFFSVVDQMREGKKISVLTTYLTALFFGIIAISGMATMIREYSRYDLLYKGTMVVGVVLGAAVCAWSDHLAGNPFSFIRGTLEGFTWGFIILAVVVLFPERDQFTRWAVARTAAGVTVGGVLSWWLALNLARARGKTLILTPAVLSPVPGMVVFGYLFLFIPYLDEIIEDLF